MNHLEQLVFEYYDWRGYIVRSNTKVGRLPLGGWEMELDIVAFNPITKHLIHIEPSIDANSWTKREERFKKKFEAGNKYIKDAIFPWLKNSDFPIEQIAVLISHPKNRNMLEGGKIISIDEFVGNIRNAVKKLGIMGKNAVPEKYPLLRTIQLITNGYYGIVIGYSIRFPELLI